MKLMAATAAAAVARPMDAVAAPAPAPAKKKPEPPSGPPPPIRAEIETQKKALAETLKVIRSFPLPPGSPPAHDFRALKRDRPSRGR